MVKSTLARSDQEIFSNFDLGTLDRGKKYHSSGKVKSINISNDGSNIVSSVSGRGQNLYEVDIDIEDNKIKGVDVEGGCSCYVGYNCKHVVAALLKAQEIGYKPLSIFESRQIKPTSALGLDDANRWMTELTNSLSDDGVKNGTKEQSHHLLYILSTQSCGEYENTVDIEVIPKISKLLKKGGYGKPQNYDIAGFSQQKYLQPIDEEIISTLEVINNSANIYSYSDGGFVLNGRKSTQVLKDIIDTGRCYWNKVTEYRAKYNDSKVDFRWELLPDGNQMFKAFIGNDPVDVCILDELLYVDEDNNTWY